MKKKNIKERLLYLFLIGVCVLILGVIVGVTWIGYEVNSQCQAAKRQYGGECVVALIRQLEDEKQDFSTRNKAIWSLGQLGDTRAHQVLRSYYTGVIPAREPLHASLSQYELQKAVNLTDGGMNLTAVFWRMLIK